MAKKTRRTGGVRHLVLVLGDQLDPRSSAFDGFDDSSDVAWMAEVREESTHVWSSKPRTALFLTAMRHFRDALDKDGRRVDYHELDPQDRSSTLASRLLTSIKEHRPERLVLTHPGDHRVLESLRDAARSAGVPLDVREDRHFVVTPEEFEEHAEGRKQLRMEFFYREVRRKLDVLLDAGEPAGGKWNYDADNRVSFGKDGPRDVPERTRYRHDQTTKDVLALVGEAFASHPGRLDSFDWPATPHQAKRALDEFIEKRLPKFGDYQDAMWTDEPWLYHSLLSSSLNLKLLDPRDVVSAAEDAYRSGHAPLNAVEGFVRQVIGWREYVRGIYWMHAPEYVERNALGADLPLPKLYWMGETEMECLRQAVSQTLEHGYAHHIQRLMVTGLFALMLGVRPKAVHEWYLAVYVDAVEWVELPNVLGMSQYADGGVMASKPYCATGKYVDRMSNYCKSCRYDPKKATGDEACPFTTLYWDFLARNEKKLGDNQRMPLQLKNVDRKSKSELKEIRARADELKAKLTAD